MSNGNVQSKWGWHDVRDGSWNGGVRLHVWCALAWGRRGDDQGARGWICCLVRQWETQDTEAISTVVP
eukprot:11845400-Prorocentrum_lima.AAC.1